MHDLTLVGVHDDGEHLLLTSSDGQKYRVRVDEAMRAAVRRDRPRLGQLQIQLDGGLRPRDIQARIRAGESAAQIAEDCGLPIEYVSRYEGPVLAEREFVARQARGVQVRGSGPAEPPTLDDLVASRLSAREVDPDDAAWDAWRADDGNWTVTVSFTAGSRPRRARWTYDTQLRHLTPCDDEARWLTESEPEPSPAAATHRRLVPIRDADQDDDAGYTAHVYEVNGHGGVQPSASSRDAWPAPSTVDLLDTLSERRGRRQRPVIDHDHIDRDDLDDVLGVMARDDSERSADERTTPDLRGLRHEETEEIPTPRQRDRISGLPPAAHPPASRPESADDSEVVELPETPSTDRTDRRPTVVNTQIELPDDAAPEEPEPASVSAGSAKKTAAANARRAKRPSVPSWDDIVFGGRRE